MMTPDALRLRSAVATVRVTLAQDGAPVSRGGWYRPDPDARPYLVDEILTALRGLIGRHA